MNDRELVIDVQGITKSFGAKTVVREINMQVARGEIYGFLGPNGSGKTTFIRMLCGLLRPDKGNGVCLGYNILEESDRIKPHVGYMSQKFSLYEDLTVQENLDFTARIYGLKNPRPRVNECVERMGLERFRNQLAGRLSGGWKQRLALTSCILHQPDLLLLDEPTAGVDPSARRDFWDEIHHLASEGITALISTHYMDEAERCHRLAYIAYGDLLAAGTTEELIRNSGLITWRGVGPGLHRMAAVFKSAAGVDQAAAFGNALHVCGKDRDALASAIAPYQTEGNHWEEIKTSLEEVFISLMRGAAVP